MLSSSIGADSYHVRIEATVPIAESCGAGSVVL